MILALIKSYCIALVLIDFVPDFTMAMLGRKPFWIPGAELIVSERKTANVRPNEVTTYAGGKEE